MTTCNNLLLEKKRRTFWSGKVRVRPEEEPEPGTFATGSSNEIASEMCKKAEGDAGTAVKKISFYINRAGKTLKPGIRKRAEAAKNLIQRRGC